MNKNTTTETLTLLHQNLDGTDFSEPLTQLREREIVMLCHLTTNPTNEEVAGKMCISPKSAANYKNRVGEKLELKGHNAVCRFVLKNYEFFKKLADVFIPQLPEGQNRKQETGNFLRRNKFEVLLPHRLSF